MDMKFMTLTEFADKTAGKESVPGGGSVSALSGALAAALAGMVAGLTIGKKGYEEHEQDMVELGKQAADLRLQLLDDIQRDSTSFNGYMDALAMPKDTDEEKAVRRAAMQNALKHAAQVPFEVAVTSLKIMPLAKTVVIKGNSNAVTDGLVAAMMTRTAVLGALYNVKINLGSIKDEEYVSDMKLKVSKVEAEAVSMEKEIIALANL